MSWFKFFQCRIAWSDILFCYLILIQWGLFEVFFWGGEGGWFKIKHGNMFYSLMFVHAASLIPSMKSIGLKCLITSKCNIQSHADDFCVLGREINSIYEESAFPSEEKIFQLYLRTINGFSFIHSVVLSSRILHWSMGTVWSLKKTTAASAHRKVVFVFIINLFKTFLCCLLPK